MSSIIEQFSYELTKGDNFIIDPSIKLCLKTWGDKTGSGAPVISGSLVTEGEIEFQVNQLKLNLDKVAKDAKMALEKALRENINTR